MQSRTFEPRFDFFRSAQEMSTGPQPEPAQVLELVAIGREDEALRSRDPATGATLFVHPGLSPVLPVEGELFSVAVRMRWRTGRYWSLAGSIVDARLDLAALDLLPLELRPLGASLPFGMPRQGVAPVSPLELRSDYELEAVEPPLPGKIQPGPGPLTQIRQLWESGDAEVALVLAGDLFKRDLRCLGAHALLGRFWFEGPLEHRWLERALRHFRVGLAIGDLSVSEDFKGRLPWERAGNRAFLSCLYGYGLCLWRLGQLEGAISLIERLRRLEPSERLGAGKILEGLEMRRSWDPVFSPP